MILNFFIQYHTTHGQSLYLVLYSQDSENATGGNIFHLNYFDDNYWNGVVDSKVFGIKNKLWYSCYVTHNSGDGLEEIIPKKALTLKHDKKQEINIYEQIIQQENYDAIYANKAFEVLFKKDKHHKVKEKACKHPTHIFKVTAPVMQSRYAVCITGTGGHLNDWDKSEPVILHKKKNYWTVELNLAKEHFPIEYKLGLYDFETKTIVHFEEGDNRLLQHNDEHHKLNILFHNAAFNDFHWRGAGINIPVSSLRTNKSWGIGDFTDLHLLADWAQNCGLKMIQLLPVNDTTATYTAKDSYPYSAISPFALHPLYLNIQKLATALSIEFPAEIVTSIEVLNAKPSLDYEGVLDLKMKAVKFVYQLEKHGLRDDFGWIEFFDLNRHWLVPYAVFCFLRDENATADFNKWEILKEYNEAAVQEFASPDNKQYDEICVHYFIQYHLHLQLKDAVDYAHKKNIIYKGDLPIGIGRCSVDSWMYPHLFHFDMQAGAPPDYYSAKGQNWSFPTYNWEAMAADGYKWWRQRMEQLGNYFDAIRIDHVLGFFRIWSIPVASVEGTLGIFQPVFPIPAEVFNNNNINLDKARFCQPFINDAILNEYFSENADWVKQLFLSKGVFKKEYNTQQKIVAFFKLNPQKKKIANALLRLMCNVILIEDEKQPEHYHFRINMFFTDSYKNLPDDIKHSLDNLYHQYFFVNQNVLWEAEGIKKLAALKGTTDMLLCAEDLGMVPDFMERVLNQLEILSLQVQRMPKTSSDHFADPKAAPYLSVITPATHDMSTVREWWQHEREYIQYFFNHILNNEGVAPANCEPWISKQIIEQQMFSPAMWSVFLLQDLMGMDATIRSQDIAAERINDPSNGDHEWNYRMHISLEDLIANKNFTLNLKDIVLRSGR
ncbi:MAG: 4-alpha-glucanotransferase [Ferruginibacter sp.]